MQRKFEKGTVCFSCFNFSSDVLYTIYKLNTCVPVLSDRILDRLNKMEVMDGPTTAPASIEQNCVGNRGPHRWTAHRRYPGRCAAAQRHGAPPQIT